MRAQRSITPDLKAALAARQDATSKLLTLRMGTEVTEITTQDVDDALHMLPGGGIGRHPLDGRYWALDRELWPQIAAILLEWDDKRHYVADLFDCDNYALGVAALVTEVLEINTVGVVIDYGGGHAYNVVVFSDKTAALFEPQSGFDIPNGLVVPGTVPYWLFSQGMILL